MFRKHSILQQDSGSSHPAPYAVDTGRVWRCQSPAAAAEGLLYFCTTNLEQRAKLNQARAGSGPGGHLTLISITHNNSPGASSSSHSITDTTSEITTRSSSAAQSNLCIIIIIAHQTIYTMCPWTITWASIIHGVSHWLCHEFNHGLSHGLSHDLSFGLSHNKLPHGVARGVGHGMAHDLTLIKLKLRMLVVAASISSSFFLVMKLVRFGLRQLNFSFCVS